MSNIIRSPTQPQLLLTTLRKAPIEWRSWFSLRVWKVLEVFLLGKHSCWMETNSRWGEEGEVLMVHQEASWLLIELSPRVSFVLFRARVGRRWGVQGGTHRHCSGAEDVRSCLWRSWQLWYKFVEFLNKNGNKESVWFEKKHKKRKICIL